MSISSLYSNLTPTLIVDPRNSRRLDPRFTFSRASSATYVNRQKVITTAKANEPFVEWDPATGSCLGLSLWGAVTNLLLRSEEFDNASWIKIAATVTANATTSPAGTSTADKLVETTANAEHIIYQGRSAQNETVTLSIFAKSAERSRIRIGFSNFVNAACGAIFNLSAGTVIFIDAANADYTSPVASIIAYPSGWYRCVFTVTKGTVNNTNNPFIDIVNNSNQIFYTGDGTSGAYIWGAQLQTGSTVGPYVPTQAATVSTSATTLSLTGTEFARIWNTRGLGIYAEAIIAQASNGSNQFIARASDGSYNNAMALNVIGSGFLQTAVTANGTLYNVGSSSALVSGNLIKTATRINTNDLSLAHVNSTFTNNVVTLPSSLNRLDIGADHLGLNAMVGMYLRRLCVYPRGLTDSQMLQLIRG